MLEGLFISLVGMGAVFVSLTIIMFLMVVVGRIFRNDGLAMSDGLAVEGMVGIDMEMSALFSIAAYHGKKVAGIFVVSDNPAEGSSFDPIIVVSNIMSNLHGITQDVFRICIEALTGPNP